MAGANVMPALANSADDRQEQRVVLAVLPRGDKMWIEATQRAQVGQVLEPGPALKEQDLVDLAGHRDVAHAVAAKVADRPSEPRQPDPVEVVADLGQRRIGMVLDAQAIDPQALAAQALGDDDRIAAPAGDQADASRCLSDALADAIGAGEWVRSGKSKRSDMGTAVAGGQWLVVDTRDSNPDSDVAGLPTAPRVRLTPPLAGRPLGIVFTTLALQLVDRGLQRFELPPHLGQLGEGGLLDLLIALGRGGNADHGDAGGHVVADAGLGAQHGASADVHVVAHADLAGHHHVVARGRAAGDADLRADHVVPADAAVVGDHHLVVDLGAVADDRRAVGAAVDGRAGADLDVGAELDAAQLRRPIDGGRRRACSRSRGAQHGAGVDDRTRADDRVFVEHGVGEDRHVLAELAAGHDVDAGVDRRAGADLAVVADRGAGMHVDVVGQASRDADRGGR